MTGHGTADLDRRLEDYLAHRRSFGFSLERDAKRLAQFPGYLREHDASTMTIERAVN